jgi:hypothetical protein
VEWELPSEADSWSIPYLYGTKGSLACSQEPVTDAVLIQSKPSNSLISILMLSCLLLGLAGWYFPLTFYNCIFVCISLIPMHDTCPTYLTSLDLFILIILHKEYEASVM